MTTIQKLFVLSFFAFIGVFSQTTADAAGYLKIEGIPGEFYNVQRVEAPPADGTHVIATHKRNEGQIVLAARGGKIQSIFAKTRDGKTKTLEAATASCSQGGFCTTFQIKKCFTLPSGHCFCVCGPWISSNSNGSSLGGDLDGEGTVNIADLSDGVNVIAQTREHILLAVIIERGQIQGLGSIDRQGGFHPFLPDGPCSDFIVQPCADGSAPIGGYDPYTKTCVAYCDGLISPDPAYKPMRPYSLRPDSPCKDYLAQPCPSGGKLITYYDPYTKKCVAMCDF